MKLERTHAEQGKMLSYCELNLETWRQLWRVLEISDIILVIVDARYPVSKTNSVHQSLIFIYEFFCTLSRYWSITFHIAIYRLCCFRHRYSNTSRKHCRNI